MNFEVFTSVILGMLAYNIILKAIGATIISSILKSEEGKKQSEKVKKTFKERLEEKRN